MGGRATRKELALKIRDLFPRFAGRKDSEASNSLSNALNLLAFRGLIENLAHGVWALTLEGIEEAKELRWEKVIETISPGSSLPDNPVNTRFSTLGSLAVLGQGAFSKITRKFGMKSLLVV